MTSSESRWIAAVAVLLITSRGSISMNPTDPLTAIWDVPPGSACARQGVVVDPMPFGFTVNGQRGFDGDQIVLFYEAQLGLYPRITTTGDPINGGVPQMANLDAHLAKAMDDIEALIPASNFTGVAVIDWESWHPLWALNYDGARQAYQNHSRSLVRKQHPDWNATQIEKESTAQFESAAKRLMTQTLMLARRMRPNGFWGFYGFPTCRNEGSPASCLSMDENDRTRWIFDNSTALFPSLYFHQRMALDNIPKFVSSNMKEGFRLVNATKPIVPFVNQWIGSNPYSLLNKTELSTLFTAMVYSAVPGFVLWGSSSEVSNVTGCTTLRNYLLSVLGPVTQGTLELATLCSTQECHGHGRCADLLHQKCICFQGSSGTDCSLPTARSSTLPSSSSPHQLYLASAFFFSVIFTALSPVIQCHNLLFNALTG